MRRLVWLLGKKMFSEYHSNSRFLFALFILLHTARLIISYPNVSMQHESMPHFMRLKLLMIFMDLSLVTVASQTTMELWLWDKWDMDTYTDRKEALSDSASLRSWEVGSIHPWHWTNLFTPPPAMKPSSDGGSDMNEYYYCHLSQIKANQTPHLHHAGHAAVSGVSVSFNVGKHL